tara:strand:+ start:209 stop:349 length:141 start_codon:yes stop_codon:yes gene_type:complete
MDIVVNYFGIAYGLQRPQNICVLAKAGENFPIINLRDAGCKKVLQP